jgi:membrane protein implicated in regulation of membrane protease activity
VAVHAWVWWLIAAAGLIVVEVLTLDLVFAMLAAGAAAGAAVSAAGVGAQIAAAVLVALAGVLGVRPVALRHLRNTPELRTGTAALVGRHCVVLDRVDGRGGQVKLAGEVWSARAYDETKVFEPGADVQVLEIAGATALVG